MEDRLKTIIRDWLNETFGNPDALPTPVLNGLAEKIEKHRWEIYNFTKSEYDMEDIERAAADREIELTDEEAKIVLNEYQNSDYQDIDTIDYFLERIIETRKEKKIKSDDSE